MSFSPSTSSSPPPTPPPVDDPEGCVPVVAIAGYSALADELPTTTSRGSLSPPELDSALRVRFEGACVLIPDAPPPPRLPRLVRKSYSVSFWRKKSQEFSAASLEFSSDEHVVLKVSVPSLTRSCSPIRAEPQHQPLAPCIVSPDSPRSPSRSPHLRRTSSPPLPSALVSVPLRACCPGCFPTTDAGARAGDAWVERFSRGARRLHDSGPGARARQLSKVCDAPGFGDVLAVDEVERKRASRGEARAVGDEPEREAEMGLLPSITRGRIGAAAVSQSLPGPSTSRDDPSDIPPPPSSEDPALELDNMLDALPSILYDADSSVLPPDAPPYVNVASSHASPAAPSRPPAVLASAPIPVPGLHPHLATCPPLASPPSTPPATPPTRSRPPPPTRKMSKSPSADSYLGSASPGARRRPFAQMLAPAAILRAGAGVLTSLSSGMGGGTALSV